ncbi:hypothetical protein Shyhy01_21730 [Streptomyces hygroscopicus subsp. hygroscopicus]|nr:hypothetical protein Shyhy01_21730 [Streptomyces hygroscopicus subsp. hygroscopicus]
MTVSFCFRLFGMVSSNSQSELSEELIPMRRALAACLLAIGVTLLGATSSFAATTTTGASVQPAGYCGEYGCGGW